MSGASSTTVSCQHCQFGLVVTGDGENDFLPKLFSTLSSKAGCSFKVLRQIDQRAPITQKRRLKMVGSGAVIPDKDEVEIGLEARRFLREGPCRFVIVVDDVEHARRMDLPAIWTRYRTAVDTMLTLDERRRASVHFLANMLEAYYFADSQAVNAVLEIPLLAQDSEHDVEEIRHPKNDLKSLARAAGTSFDEVEDGRKIISRLDVSHVLSNPTTCAFLRSLFGWCVHQLVTNCPIWDESVSADFFLADGIRSNLTSQQ